MEQTVKPYCKVQNTMKMLYFVLFWKTDIFLTRKSYSNSLVTSH